MSLPKIELPLFELELPSTKQKLKYRPFTVKEEKILLIAQESQELEQTILAVKQIVSNCFSEVDVEKLALFDLEYLLLALRIKSVSNEVKFTIKDPDTEKNVELEINLESVKLIEKEDHDTKIHINDESFLVMRYPTVNEILILQKDNTAEMLMDIMISCIDNIVSGDEVYKSEDFTKEQMVEFLDTLPSTTIKDLEHFFNTMPTMRHEMKYVNENGDEKTFVVEGLDSFFL